MRFHGLATCRRIHLAGYGRQGRATGAAILATVLTSVALPVLAVEGTGGVVICVALSRDGLAFRESGEVFLPRASAPDLIRLSDGSLLALLERLPTGGGATTILSVSRSADDGQSWSRPREIRLRSREGREIKARHGTVLNMPDGTVRLYFAAVERGNAGISSRPNEVRTIIRSAVSRNGLDYVMDDAVAIPIDKPGDFAPGAAVVNRHVHLYVAVTRGDADYPEREQAVLHFESADGRRFRRVAFTESGVRSVDCVVGVDGYTRVYATFAEGIGSFVIKGGRRWVAERGMRLMGARSAAVVRRQDGAYLALYGTADGPRTRGQVGLALAGARDADGGRIADEGNWPALPVLRAGAGVEGNGSVASIGDAVELIDAQEESPENGTASAAVERKTTDGDGAGDGAVGPDGESGVRSDDVFAPKPDFTSPVDYVKWVQDHAITDVPENANLAYESFMPGVTPKPSDALWPENFNDMFNGDYSGPALPWTPEQYPEWEASYQQVLGLLDQFRRATRMTGYAQGLTFGPNADPNEEPLLMAALMPTLSGHRKLTKATLAHAWRAPDGVVPPAQMLDALETTLRGASHMNRGWTLIHRLVGLAESTFVQTNALAALERNVFTSPEQLERALHVLETYDVADTSADCWLPGETACSLQLIQYLFAPATPGGEPRLNAQRAQGLTRTFGVEQDEAFVAETERLDGAGVRQTVDTLDAYWRDLREKWNKGYPLVRSRDLEESAEKMAQTNSLTRRLIPSLARAYHLTWRNEASRRAAQLTYAVHLFHARAGRWPATIDELPPEHGETMRTDPFSGGRFGYRITEAGPVIYSASENGRDDGGVHSPRWDGSENGGQSDDYVFWPPQK